MGYKENKSTNQKRKETCTPVFTAANSQYKSNLSATKRWMDKEDVVLIYTMEYYSAKKEKKSCHLD